MREKILFFILGAVTATLAYFAGSSNESSAIDKGKYDLLVVDSLIVRSIIVSESGKDGDSMIGLRVDDNIPSINISNRKNAVEKSGIMLSAFSETDAPGSIPLFILIDADSNENYTLTSSGVYRR